MKQQRTQNMMIGALIGIAMASLGFVAWSLIPSSIHITELSPGVGEEAREGMQVVFHYEAFLRDPSQKEELGLKWNSTYERHQPQAAVLGSHQVIPGLEEALVGMKTGAKRLVRIPSGKAYGKQGAAGGLIPPGADLVYRVEMKVVGAL